MVADDGYPTLARHLVFDSRAVSLQDLDRSQAFTPVLAVYTAESGARLRGPLSDALDISADAVIDIVAELAVVASDEDGDYADAMALDDPEARLVLAALTSQVRFLFEHSQKGRLWRCICKQIREIEMKTFAVPQLGLRYQRTTMRLHCDVMDDDFDVPAGELPEPMRTLFAALPAGSYAKAKLAALAAHFNPDVLPDLDGVTVTTGPVQSGL